MPWIPLAMAAAGMIKGQSDSAKQERQTQLAAATQRYSPWTGLKAQPIDQANPGGDAMQGGMAGLQMKQGMDKAATDDALKKAMMQYYQNGTPALNYAGSSAGAAGSTPWSLGDYNFSSGG